MSNQGEEDEEEEEPETNKNKQFNYLGINTLVNLHSHIQEIMDAKTKNEVMDSLK